MSGAATLGFADGVEVGRFFILITGHPIHISFLSQTDVPIWNSLDDKCFSKFQDKSKRGRTCSIVPVSYVGHSLALTSRLEEGFSIVSDKILDGGMLTQMSTLLDADEFEKVFQSNTPRLEVARSPITRKDVPTRSTSGQTPGLEPLPSANVNEHGDYDASSPSSAPFVELPKNARSICSLPWKRFYLLVGLILILLIVIIATAVGVTQSKHKSSKKPQMPSPTQPGSATSASTSPSASGTRSINTGIRVNSSIAALSFTSTYTGVNNTSFGVRVYYQDDDDYLRLSAFDSTTGKWSVWTLPVRGMPQTPLATLNVPDSPVS